MLHCPACGHEFPVGAPECPHCGVVPAKWRPKEPSVSPPIPAAPVPASSGQVSRRRRPTAALAVGLLIGAVAVVLFWRVAVAPRLARIRGGPPVEEGRAHEVVASVDAVSDFDRSLPLPIDPLGLATDGKELLIGNRGTGGTFLRARPLGREKWALAPVTLRETVNDQVLSFGTVAHGDGSFLAYADGAWFARPGTSVFVRLDASSLKPVRHFGAPPLLGCLAWDGASWWGATRKNTQDSKEEAWLYRLDRNLNVVSRHPPPTVGCQGMAWNEGRLFMAGVFDDRIHVLDVTEENPVLLSSHQTRFPYLSGLAVLDGAIWVTEYGERKLHRLNPRLLAAWLHGPREREPRLARAVAATPLDPDELASLRRDLRDDHWATRLRARSKLQQNGYPVDFARAQDRFEKEGEEEVAVPDWWVEARGGKLLGSWTLRFGKSFFTGTAPSDTVVSVPVFARYTLTVTDDASTEKASSTFDARPGINEMRDVELAAGLPPGKYTVSLFVHVQWYDAAGKARILNKSTTSLEVDL